MVGGCAPGEAVGCRRETEAACPWAWDLASELDIARERLLDAEEELRGHREEIERLAALTGQLEEAMASRPVIDQAKGVIVGETGCHPEDAFRRLVAVSRSRNVKVRVVARSIIDQAQRPKWIRRAKRQRDSPA
jgi:hypothetical protein